MAGGKKIKSIGKIESCHGEKKVRKGVEKKML
jgi:hypothetical protein